MDDGSFLRSVYGLKCRSVRLVISLERRYASHELRGLGDHHETLCIGGGDRRFNPDLARRVVPRPGGWAKSDGACGSTEREI